jgi:peptidoglycan hydrolase CwlO-like protein
MVILTKSKKIIIYFVVIDAILLLAVLIARPIIVGYTVYSQIKELNQSLDTYTKNIGDIRSEMLMATNNLSYCYSMNQQLLSKMQEDNSKILDYQTQINSLKREINDLEDNCKEEKEGLQKEVDEKTAELADLKEDYGNLVRNTANNVCCKAKIDNPRIKYYKVEGDKIVCLEEGSLEISCAL